MARKVLVTVVAALILCGATLTAPVRAGAPQIEDPAGDHPVPFMDFTGVSLAVVPGKGGPALETTFLLSGMVGAESRATMTGYSLTAKVGKCDLLVRFVGYPDGAFDASGFVTTKCGDGRDVGGSFKITDTTIAVQSPLRDLKGVEIGLTMTELAAFNAPVEGMYHDDTTAPAAAGDAAASDKPWTIS